MMAATCMLARQSADLPHTRLMQPWLPHVLLALCSRSLFASIVGLFCLYGRSRTHQPPPDVGCRACALPDAYMIEAKQTYYTGKRDYCRGKRDPCRRWLPCVLIARCVCVCTRMCRCLAEKLPRRLRRRTMKVLCVCVCVGVGEFVMQ